MDGRRTSMSMGRKRGRQRAMFVATAELADAPRHRFYESLNEFLREAGFDAYAEQLCARFYEKDGTAGRPSIPPGVYFRMLLVGFFEGIESERGICWRCSDSLSLKKFLGFEPHEETPDHSTLSRTRHRLDESVFRDMFRFVLGLIEERGLLKGKVAGVDSTYLRADASMKGIVRRDTGEGYKAFLRRLAQEEGLEELNDEELRRFDRKRKGKRSSNKEWTSPVDPDAEIMKLKDGRTRLAYKAEHVVDMETGAILAAELLPATTGDATSLPDSLDEAQTNIERADDLAEREGGGDDEDPPTGEGSKSETGASERKIEEVVADKGYHKAETIKRLRDREIRTYIPERVHKGRRKWGDKGGRATAVAVYQNRARVKRKKSRALQRRRGELIERTFAHMCETGAHRRVRLRGRVNANKRYLLHAAGTNLALLMRQAFGFGTPRGLTDGVRALAAVLRRLCAAVRSLRVPAVPLLALLSVATGVAWPSREASAVAPLAA